MDGLGIYIPIDGPREEIEKSPGELECIYRAQLGLAWHIAKAVMTGASYIGHLWELVSTASFFILPLYTYNAYVSMQMEYLDG